MDTFIITFRESLEASVIVGMLLAILQAFHIEKKSLYIWGGVVTGVIGSLIFAAIFHYFLGGFSGKAEKIYEGILMFLAAGMITHMVFWMGKRTKYLRTELKNKVENIIESKTLWMLGALSFFAVVREGIETVIFLNAIDAQSDWWTFCIAIFGIISAIILSIGIYYGSKNIPTRKFFHISSIFLLFIAGGLIAHGIVELQGAGWLPTYIKPVFDLSGVLSEKEGIGQFLKALFGYDANPSLFALIAYGIFIPTSVWYYQKRNW